MGVSLVSQEQSLITQECVFATNQGDFVPTKSRHNLSSATPPSADTPTAAFLKGSSAVVGATLSVIALPWSRRNFPRTRTPGHR